MDEAMPRLPRGLRNKNPGNIRSGSELWQGQTGADEDGYCQFDEDRNGIRAIAKCLLTYERRYGINTPRGIISRWAPPSENDTEAYIKHLAYVLEVDSDTPVNVADPETLRRIVRTIIVHECGECPFNSHVIADGVARALAS